MSVEALAVCLHHSRAAGTVKLVLLGVANHAGDGGAWPTVSTLAKYANVHPRNVQKALVRLQSLGELDVAYQEGGLANLADKDRPNLYTILVRCPVHCDGTVHHRDTRKPIRTIQPPLFPQSVDKRLRGGESATPTPGESATPTPGESATLTIPGTHPPNSVVAATGTTGAGPVDHLIAEAQALPPCSECGQLAARCLSVPARISGHTYVRG